MLLLLGEWDDGERMLTAAAGVVGRLKARAVKSAAIAEQQAPIFAPRVICCR